MALTGQRTFVGFGFGAIQAGLFLYEAFQSGNFGRLVVAEVMPEIVESVRRAGGWYTVNIAHGDGIERAQVGPVEIMDPAVEGDRQALVAALAEAEEIATAVPSVGHYVAAGPGSLHRLLAAGLHLKGQGHGPRAIIYAAENHNHAAEILQGHVLSTMAANEGETVEGRVCFLNTVIGKMSGVVSDTAQIASQGLATITPSIGRAFLVEAFNRILISRIRFPESGGAASFGRGITVFEEKDDLLPFEEAKLYGHNATHALAAYLGAICGARRITDLQYVPGMMPFLRSAFMEESGEALMRRWTGVDDLFTPPGYAAYADDLLRRMMNPYLNDTVERVGRDAQRKLGWDDRLIGTMRVALRQGVYPRRYAMGAAAAVALLHPEILGIEAPPFAALLQPCWKNAGMQAGEQDTVLALIAEGHTLVRHWRASGFADLALIDTIVNQRT